MELRRYEKNEKVLLMLAPFWAPLIPPLGSSCLKSYANSDGYSNIKIVDSNLETNLWEYNSKYISKLETYIPIEKKGNFQMLANDVLMNHLMVHINYSNEASYRKLIHKIVEVNFYHSLTDFEISGLSNILDDFYNDYAQYLISVIESENPKILGMTVYSTTLAVSYYTFRLVKEKFPDVLTVMGGGVFADQLDTKSPNFEFFIKKADFIDVLLVGEGEVLFLKLLKGELNSNKKVHTLADINYETIDLDKVKMPDYSQLDVDRYTHLCSYTSRSCPYQCSFCSETVQWGSYRKKKAKKVVDELSVLNRMYGRSLFLLGDSLVNPIVDDLSEEMIQRDKEIYWDAYLRADKPVCDISNTMKWRKGGFYRARLGIESGSQHVLTLMNKKTNPDQIKQALNSLATAGIKTTTYWVIGHPGETDEDFQETLDLLTESANDIYEADWHPFYFFPTGQTNSTEWNENNRTYTLYPSEAQDMLITQTWGLDTYPNRETIYKRVQLFGEHCERVGIPNPYSLKDIYEADQRWSGLHENAVPSVVDIL